MTAHYKKNRAKWRLLLCVLLLIGLPLAADEIAGDLPETEMQQDTPIDAVDAETVDGLIAANDSDEPSETDSNNATEPVEDDATEPVEDNATEPVEDDATEPVEEESSVEAMQEVPETNEGSDESVQDVAVEPLHLIDLISAQRRALADNPSIAAGSERVEQVRQLIKQARSMYFPQIDMSYTYTLNWLPSGYTDSVNSYLDETENVLRDWRKDQVRQSASTRLPSVRQRGDMRDWYNSTQDLIAETRENLESPVDNTLIGMTAGWLLFDGFAREFINAMARYGYEEAKAAFRDGQRILLDAVAQAYYGVQISREQMDIAKSDIAFYERLLKEAQARREVGRGATSHVLSFETLLYAARAGRLQAERNYEMARVILGMLMGLPDGRLDDRFDLASLEEETPETLTLPDEEAMIDLALAYRPELEQREYGLKRAQASVKQQYASFAPMIALVGQMQTSNITESGFSADRITTTVGLNASLNLFSGGRRRASVIEAKHARREAELRITEAEQKVMSDVYQALADLKVAQEALKLQREAADCVEKNRDLVELEYNAGKAMLVSLSQAQRDYMQAAGMLAQARVNLQRTWQALHAATGTNLIILNQQEDPTKVVVSSTPSEETETPE
jgi:outer membrane protein